MSGSVGRAEAAGHYLSATSPDPTPAGDQVMAGKGRTLGEMEESVLLVLVALIAAIPYHSGQLLGAGGEFC